MNSHIILEEAVRHHREGRLEQAEGLYRQILQTEPRNGNALNLLAVVQRQRGKIDDAIALARSAVSAQPRVAEYHFNLGEACRTARRFDDAIDAYHQSIGLKGDDAEVWHALGVSYELRKRHSEAVTALRRAIELRWNHAAAFEDLATALASLGQIEEALATCKRSITLFPNRVQAHLRYAAICVLKGDLKTAAAGYHHAFKLDPRSFPAHLGLTQVFNRMNRRSDAETWGWAAVALDNKNADARNALGMALVGQGRITPAIAQFERAIALAPESVDPLSNLAGALLQCRNHARAVELYRKAAELAPDSGAEQSNLLLAMNYPDDVDERELFAEHAKWGASAARRVSSRRAAAQESGNGQTIERRVETRPTRVGYVSPDLREHPVSYFIEPIFANHDRERFEVFVYSDASRPDSTTDRLKALVQHWKDVRHLSDQKLAELVRADGIDILVDLAGHTAKNRLMIFAQKPAAVQMTYLGYPNTTGLPSSVMNYRITDSICDRSGQADELYTEKLLRVDFVGSAPRTVSDEQGANAKSFDEKGPHRGPYTGFLCYRPPADAPDVAPAPFEKNGYITFGSFSSLHKVTPKTVELWSQILLRVPNARLLLKNKSLADAAATTPLFQEFAHFGIAEDRLILRTGVKEHRDHLAAYAEVDIALDTFPYHGTTTTCEALWMGVPVITLAGTVHRSRVGVSLLSAVGTPELIGDSGEQYVQIAVDLASDRQRLQVYRREMRERMAASPLRNEQAFVSRLEQLYLHSIQTRRQI